jgi:Trypsin-co-occurring domain 1
MPLIERLTPMEEIDCSRYVPILEGDRTFYVEALVLDEEEEVAARKFGLEDFARSISTVAETVSDSITSALCKVQPGKVTVEFGCEVGVNAGNLTAILVKGAAKANVKVTVEWTPQ